MRIDQLISQSCCMSRKQAKMAIRNKQVSINGNICNNAATHVSMTDDIYLESDRVIWPEDAYFILHKPAGYCCSHHDDGHPSVLRLLPETPKKLHIAGRLDADTTGLVLISSDGQWCHRVTSPKQKHEKSIKKFYRVKLAAPLSNADRELLQSGVQLHGEDKTTLPAEIEIIDSVHYNIAITEGRYHQVKRMFAAVNNRVLQLHRYRIGEITLDDTLPEGEFRQLTAEEVQLFEVRNDT